MPDTLPKRHGRNVFFEPQVGFFLQIRNILCKTKWLMKGHENVSEEVFMTQTGHGGP